jgi:nitroreductase
MTTDRLDAPSVPAVSLTSEEQEAVARAFERTPSLFRLLSTIRTRRMGLGYRSETGEEETFTWSSGQTLRQDEGPLAHSSAAEPVPLTEVEEALVAWAALGPNGVVAADIPVQGDLSSLLHWAGRTAPGSSNDLSVDLFVINDRGVHLYRPGTERMAPVEIQGPEDYWKILHWYRAGLTTVSDRRPDVAWGAAPPGTHNVNPVGALQYNLDRPGSTWFLPVGDLGREWINFLLSSYQFSGFYLEDPRTKEPAGCKEWIRPGFLEVGFPLPVFDELVLMLHASQVACVVQNIRLACEALGLGAWAIGSYADDMVLGAYPEITRGLGFSFLEREPDRNPSRTATCLGLQGVFEAHAVPSPWFPTARAAVQHVVDLRYASGMPLARGDNWALRAGAPFKPEVLERILEHPKAHIPDWVIEAAVDTIDYIVQEYQCAPAFISPVRAKFSCQVHHVDEEYYRRFHAGDGKPYLVTAQIESHFSDWHPGADAPAGGIR